MPADTISAPVEIAIIEFPGSRFNGEIVPALTQLVDDGIVAIIDLVLVNKDVDGSVTVLELLSHLEALVDRARTDPARSTSRRRER